MSVLMRKVGETAWLSLNRPECGNAIDSSTIMDLDRMLDELIQQREAIRCLVLTGIGSTFCSGIDLRAIGVLKGRMVENREIVVRAHFDHLIIRLIDYRIPIVAALQGPAIGAGMTLALTADVIVMQQQAYLHPSYTALGFVPDQGMSFLLPRLIGGARARTAMMLAQKIDAATALEWGLAHKLADSGDLDAEVQTVTERIAAGPRHALGISRSLWLGSDLSQLRDHMRRERSAQESAASYGECTEGVRAFLEKRSPKY